MTDQKQKPSDNTPDWANEIIKFLKDQNRSLTKISEEANYIGRKSNFIGMVALVATALSLITSIWFFIDSIFRYEQTNELAKKNIIFQQLMDNRKEAVTALNKTKLYSENLLMICDELSPSENREELWDDVSLALNQVGRGVDTVFVDKLEAAFSLYELYSVMPGFENKAIAGIDDLNYSSFVGVVEVLIINEIFGGKLDDEPEQLLSLLNDITDNNYVLVAAMSEEQREELRSTFSLKSLYELGFGLALTAETLTMVNRNVVSFVYDHEGEWDKHPEILKTRKEFFIEMEEWVQARNEITVCKEAMMVGLEEAKNDESGIL